MVGIHVRGQEQEPDVPQAVQHRLAGPDDSSGRPGIPPVGRHVGHVSWPAAATPLGAAALVHFLVNRGTVALAVALSTGQRAGHIWLHDFAWAASSYFVGMGAAAVGAVIVERSAFALLPFATGPLYVMYRVSESYIARFEDERVRGRSSSR